MQGNDYTNETRGKKRRPNAPVLSMVPKADRVLLLLKAVSFMW